MTQLKPIRISYNTKITSRISTLLYNISHLFLLYLICFLLICEFESIEVNAQDQQTDSDRTINVPVMQWINLGSKLSGLPPPGLKDFAFGFSNFNQVKNAVIFGGTTPDGSKSGATYILDLNGNAWTTLPTLTNTGINPQFPEARSNMIYGIDASSSYRNALIISCGIGSGKVLYNDVWAFDISYKQWQQVNVSGNIPPLMYGSIGGIDVTLKASIQTEETNTLWASHGTNGSHFFTDLYALVTTGTLSPNVKDISATWQKVNVNGDIPPGRSSAAGAILPNKRLAIYGGCDQLDIDGKQLDGKCALSDTYLLDLGSSYTYKNVSTATPSWSKRNTCLGSRSGAAMVMVTNSNPTLPVPNQAIVYGGSSSDGKSVGQDGEVGVFDAGLGNWVRVLPQKDPNSNPGFPPQRKGAQMVPISPSIEPGFPGTDILLFGGESLVDGTNLNDVWILRLSDNYTSGNAVNPPEEFLNCITPEPRSNNGAGGTSNTNKGTGNEDRSNGNYFEKSTIRSHVTFSTISFVCLPLAASVIRFGYGSNQTWAIAGLYTIFIVVSYATAFYGFAIAFQKSSGHFITPHGSLGLVLLILLYIFVPLMAIISLCASKKYESDLILNDTSDNDKGGIRSKLTVCFNLRNSESSSKPAKSFEVSRPGNRLVSGGETPSQSPPMSMLKSSDNWMEKRKSVTNHPTISSQGSRNSLQNGQNSRRTSQSTAVSRSGLQTSTSPKIIIRRIHHVIAQIILILTAIYIEIELITKEIVDPLYYYLFIVFIVIIYLTWIIAAQYGYPKGRNSLLVLFMHKIACGKGEVNEMKQYDFEENGGNGGNGAISPRFSSNRMRIEDNEMDEEAEQAQLEQDMHNREVVVMTIPKRRLTVVNA